MTRPCTTVEGALVRQARLGTGLSGRQLAAALGVKTATISQWETGTTIPSVTRLREVASACGMSLHLEMRNERKP